MTNQNEKWNTFLISEKYCNKTIYNLNLILVSYNKKEIILMSQEI
jgi:hypothetical protein